MLAEMPSRQALMPMSRWPSESSASCRAAQIGRGGGEKVFLEAFRQDCAGALAQVTGERARVGAQHGEHEVDAAGDLAFVLGGALGQGRDETHVTQHAKERQEREGDQAMGAVSGHVGDELEHLGRSDAIELGAKLERAQRIEIRVLLDLALCNRQERIEKAIGDARCAQEPVGNLERLRERVSQSEKAFLGGLLGHAFAGELGAGRVFGENRFQVTLKNEGSVAMTQQKAREIDASRCAVAPIREVAAEVDGHHRRASRRSGVVTRIGETGEPFEQDLELEEQLFLVVERQRRKPGFARLLLLATQTSGLQQELGISVTPSCAPVLARPLTRWPVD